MIDRPYNITGDAINSEQPISQQPAQPATPKEGDTRVINGVHQTYQNGEWVTRHAGR